MRAGHPQGFLHAGHRDDHEAAADAERRGEDAGEAVHRQRRDDAECHDQLGERP